VTLHQCDHDTRIWVESNARKLIKLQAELEQTLAKYEKVTPSKLARNKPLVQMHLRAMRSEIMQTRAKLAEHRPSLGHKYQL
jgi:hypothetical protein